MQQETMQTEQFETISDLHKDARGCRPSPDWMRWFRSLDSVSQQEVYENMAQELEESIEHERAVEARNREEFNMSFNKIAEQFGVDFDTAVRWDMDADGVDRSFKQDVEQYFWNMGLSFEDIDELAPRFVQRCAA